MNISRYIARWYWTYQIAHSFASSVSPCYAVGVISNSIQLICVAGRSVHDVAGAVPWIRGSEIEETNIYCDK